MLSIVASWALALVAVNAIPSPVDLRASRVERDLVRRDSRPTSYPANNFTQLIDHFPQSSRYEPHTNGTFTQRYFFDSTYYKDGGPVFLYIGGETSGESRFSNLETGIIQILMQEFNGLGVILENRYYGESYPFETTTTDELAYLTNEQTIADNAYFAQRATFPNVTGNLTAPNTPWILYGGSLAGAETAFSIVEYGGSGEKILYGGIASSAVVHAVHAYPQWYDPIQKLGPQDCIGRINDIVDSYDALVEANNTAAIQQLKELFGLQDLESDLDFAYTIALPIGGPDNYPLGTWQELNWNKSVSDPQWWYFCGNVTDDNAPANVTAGDSLLANYTDGKTLPGLGAYAAYFQQVYLPLCESGRYGSTDPGCFGTQNESYWNDTTPSTSRSYTYSTCTELGAYQQGQPEGKPSLLSRSITTSFTQQWVCTPTYSDRAGNQSPGPASSVQLDTDRWTNLTHYNKYGDLNITGERLAFIDGSSDVWLDVCYHSTLTNTSANRVANPNSNATAASEVEAYLINGGGHHWDSYGILDVDAEPDFIMQAHLWEIKVVKKWLDAFTSDWYKQ
ncbi:putative serine protease K12H4.7 [Cyphellophora attinorum]|uniref:Putative serine protease K12H4.7 n=1 Tax=Cyphellophora attinorum TaxID=1664694 RepID=A0A0N1NX84_9EURO|nr:putative serine protease K12H4.7 [Phialophora attinorum]KPI34765.1 putative serine protease K12H4.7 [Phialophora attinorum]